MVDKIKKICIFCGCRAEFLEISNTTVFTQGGHHIIVKGKGHIKSYGNNHIILYDTSQADLYDTSRAVLYNTSQADLYDTSQAVLYNTSRAVLYNTSQAVLYDTSRADLYDTSQADLYDTSQAVLYNTSRAVLYNTSQAVLYNTSRVFLFENSIAYCRSPYTNCIIKSPQAKCVGNSIGGKPLTPKEYLTACGVNVKNQWVILYKSVRKDNSCFYPKNVKYEIGKWIVAPDWDPNYKEECGSGLHLSPTVQQARKFNDGQNYLACSVNIKDIADLPPCASFPDKIRVRACKPLYRVDAEGKKLD